MAFGKRKQALANRPERHVAHIVTTVRRWRRISLFQTDANIVDVSEQGLKLEFHYDVEAKPGDEFWVVVTAMAAEPAESVGQAIELKAACRWYDAATQQLGAEFVGVTPEGRMRLAGLVQFLKDRPMPK